MSSAKKRGKMFNFSNDATMYEGIILALACHLSLPPAVARTYKKI